MGFELPLRNSTKTAIPEQGAAKSGAFSGGSAGLAGADEGLSELIDAARSAVELLAPLKGIDADEAERIREARDGLIRALTAVAAPVCVQAAGDGSAAVLQRERDRGDSAASGAAGRDCSR